jgi:argininosuccinate lyase
VGRFVQDMLLWCTSEVGYLRLADGFVQTSSIMPQKRNPSALEHARALLSKALGQATALPIAIHNTPFGDIVDTEDDLQPLVAAMFTDAARALMLVAATMAGADLAVDRMRERAGSGWVTVTELADTLVREHGLPFGTAHQIAASLTRGRDVHPDARLSDLLAQVSGEVLGREIRIDEAALVAILSPEHFVAVRTTPGGPAPEAVKRALGHSEARLAADGEIVSAARASLALAEGRLEAAVRAL